MIIHVDMDAFYASVEQLDNPDLKGQCVMVGGTTNRGVVSAASYEARKFGVHSAMPIFQAKQKCPDGVFVPPRMSRYKAISRHIMTILKGFSPLVEMVSIDEAYIDISGCTQILGSPREIALTIKKRVLKETFLTCSVGVAPVRFLAKIASDLDKPDGLTMIRPDQVDDFIDSLAIRKVPGVGKKSTEQLNRLGVRFLGDIKQYPKDMLTKRLGKFGHRLVELSYGIDTTPVSPESEHKSVSSEITLSKNTLDTRYLKQTLLQQSEQVSKELRKMGVKAKVVTLKLKHEDFKQITRRITIQTPTQSTKTLYKEATGLLDQYSLTRKVRLVGVGASGFISEAEPVQMGIFDKTPAKSRNWEQVDKTLDHIDKKFGKDVVRRASLSRGSKKETSS
ncbi:MAG: DNA polymerase IV [Desulfobacterales bacterium]|nr:DNA polymerase IV [Desulfobacterales bacterium]MDX2513469.1 DNA polymerase IV [Desulfobacterales bacterium]